MVGLGWRQVVTGGVGAKVVISLDSLGDAGFGLLKSEKSPAIKFFLDRAVDPFSYWIFTRVSLFSHADADVLGTE